MSWLHRWRHRRQLQRMQLLVLDVDGVLTDGGLWFDASGQLTKRFNVRDGMGIRLLQQTGLQIALLSGGQGGATEARARQLGIQHCLVGVKDKLKVLDGLQKELKIAPADTVFIGDDINDLAVRPLVGMLVAPADACAPMRHRADLVLHGCGGHGAVRELAELILQARGEWSELRRRGWRDHND